MTLQFSGVTVGHTGGASHSNVWLASFFFAGFTKVCPFFLAEWFISRPFWIYKSKFDTPGDFSNWAFFKKRINPAPSNISFFRVNKMK